jgi:hypothetical protein
MTVTVRVTCLNSLGLPNLQTFIQGHNPSSGRNAPNAESYLRYYALDVTRGMKPA